MPGLGAAYWGYLHQDVITAFALASLVTSGATVTSVTADRKLVNGDCFDDLLIEGEITTRTQIKAHVVNVRNLQLADFTTEAIDFRIDRVLAVVRNDPSGARGYRLLVTFGDPDSSISPYLIPVPSSPGLIPALKTNRYMISADAVWPLDSGPLWHHLGRTARRDFVSFCEKFVVETNCPRGSGDLRTPGKLETELLRLLRDGIGVSLPPNQDRDVADAAAHLIWRSQVLRAEASRADPAEVIRTLALRVDYGRVAEDLRIDEALVVRRPPTLEGIAGLVRSEPRLAIVGPPGSGKSWLMRLLRDYLLRDGWLAVAHYCFLDIWDASLVQRSSTDTTFGSLIAELMDLDPAIASKQVPRYSAGALELERLLLDVYERTPERRVALIIDGLDHADRSGAPLGHSAAELVQELMGLSLPPNVALVIGSQPGAHLDELQTTTKTYEVPPWSRGELDDLMSRLGLTDLVPPERSESPGLLDVIAERAGGNPLYATYLARFALQIQVSEPGLDSLAITARVSQAPSRDEDLGGYYDWLLQPVAANEGAKFVIGMLAAAGFTLTATEIGEIIPAFSQHVEPVLRQLAPVLVGGAADQGVRIYHESFQRYSREKLLASDEALRITLEPIIQWLLGKGFFADQRAFRFLPELLTAVGRGSEVIDLLSLDYVARCIESGCPGDAAANNLAIGGRVAAKSQMWPALARLVELARAANHFYNWRLDDDSLAESYGRALMAVLGPAHLVAILAHDGRCTFRPRPGLVLCGLCDAEGVAPPWSPYLDAYDRFRKTDNTVYSGGDSGVLRAWMIGQFRQVGPEDAVQLAIDFMAEPELRQHPYDIAMALGAVYGEVAVAEARDRAVQTERGWVQLAVASLSKYRSNNQAVATSALALGLTVKGLRLAIRLGADISSVAFDPGRLMDLTQRMCDAKSPDEGVTTEWLVALDVARARKEGDALLRAMLSIGGNFWYRRWLRFAVALRRETEFAVLFRDLVALSTNVEIFVGEPRVVDLFRIHHDIQESFEMLLERATDAEWVASIDVLADIGRATIAWLFSTRSGPLPVDALLEMCARTANSEMRQQATSEMATRLLDSEGATSEVYDTHAADQLLRARLLRRSNNRMDAWSAWERASIYLAAYGFRKDITIYELIDSLPSLASAEAETRVECLRKVQVLAERLLIHTDLSETRGAIHRWIDIAALLDPVGCLVQVARESLLRHPGFGGLEHAIPEALTNMVDLVDPEALTQGWLAAGAEVRTAPLPALAACETMRTADRFFHSACWSVLAASLVGDGVQVDSQLIGEVVASAERLGFDPPRFTPRPVSTDESSERTASGVDSDPGEQSADFQLLTQSQLLSTLRRLRSGRVKVAADVAEQVGTWLLNLAPGGPIDGRSVLQNIAYDTKTFYTDPFLSQLAQFLENVGLSGLSAACWTYAYTRASDGWRRFGGDKHEWMFQRAIHLDSSEAWRTLADEVGEAVSTSGPIGVNLHLVELLVLAGRLGDAIEAWNACASTIEYRLPPTSLNDVPSVVYGSLILSPSAAIAAIAIARMNNFDISQRRQAMASLASMIPSHPEGVAEAITVILTQAPESVCATVIALVQRFEQDPYPVTAAAQAALTSTAIVGPFSAAALARLLLSRANVDVPDLPPSRIPEVVLLSGPTLSFTREAFGAAVLRPIEQLWPEYGDFAASVLEGNMQSEQHKSRMKAMREHVGNSAIVNHSQLWWPLDEEINHALQVAAGGLRAALARLGQIGMNVDQEFAMHLVGNVDLGVRMAMSRTARPAYYPRPQELPDFTVGELITATGDAQYNGWSVLGHHERQLQIAPGHERKVVAQHEASSGIVYADDRQIDLVRGSLPLAAGDGTVWSGATIGPMPTPIVEGPVAAMDIERDPFGVIQMLDPGPLIRHFAAIHPVSALGGLIFVNRVNEPVLVSRCWREPLLENEYVNDRVYEFVGTELLARPDLLGRAGELAATSQKYVTVRMTSAGDGDGR